MNDGPSELNRESAGATDATIARADHAAHHAPSLLGYAPALVLPAAVVADSMQYADADLWGHIRFGQTMLGTGHLIRADVFSCTAAGRRWIDHEWLAEVVMALIYNGFGVIGLKLVKFLCAGAIMTLLALGLAETGAAMAAQFAALAAVALALIQQMQFRPQLFDYVLFAALIAMLARETYGRGAPLWLTVPMLALWANLHGGFCIGLAALGVYSAAVAAQGVVARGARLRAALRPAAITAAAALATLCNPWSLGEWRAVAQSLGNPYTLGRVSEFRPLLHTFGALHRAGMTTFPLTAMLLMLAALAAAWLLVPRGDDAAMLAVAALMAAAAFAAVRNNALAATALAVPLAYHADLAVRRVRRRAYARADTPKTPGVALAPALVMPRKMRNMGKTGKMGWALQAAVSLVAALLALRAGLFSAALRAAEPSPVGAAGFMAAHALAGNILGEYAWGGYLIWHAAKGSRVFIDSRFEMVYPPRVQRDYLDFIRGGERAAAVLAAYPTDYVMMPPNSTASRFMGGDPGWRMIYRDRVASLFARTGSPAAHIAGVPILREDAPPSFFP